MTVRVGQTTIDGSPISAADLARLEAEEAMHAEWERKAVRVVAASSEDAEDCRTLLAILGLDGEALRAARKARPRRNSSRPATRTNTRRSAVA